MTHAMRIPFRAKLKKWSVSRGASLTMKTKPMLIKIKTSKHIDVLTVDNNFDILLETIAKSEFQRRYSLSIVTKSYKMVSSDMFC